MKSDRSTDTEAGSKRSSVFASLVVWIFLVYMAIVSPLDSVLPQVNRTRYAIPLLLLSPLAVLFLARMADRARPNLFLNIALVCGTTLFGLFTADTLTSMYFNLNAPAAPLDEDAERIADSNLWDGELMPQPFFPTDSNFWIYKPLQAISGSAYGEHYAASMTEMPVLRDSVLKRTPQRFVIDEYGFRNEILPNDVGVFSLGDSFCFGYHVEQDSLWQAQLSRATGVPIYNMGVSGTSPFAQLMTLSHFLNAHPAQFRPSHVIWMIFEGNDLEEPYFVPRPSPPSRAGVSIALDGTLARTILSVPAVLRAQSVLRRLTDGRLTPKRSLASRGVESPLGPEHPPLPLPLFRSDKFGPRLFRESYIERASEPQGYLQEHPNRPLLDSTFNAMKALAGKHGFTVTIVAVPSDVRLYRPYFEELGRTSEVPYFYNYVLELSRRVGFATVDLLEALAPYAADEMIHHRDDTHWNVRGHQIVAEKLSPLVRQ